MQYLSHMFERLDSPPPNVYHIDPTQFVYVFITMDTNVNVQECYQQLCLMILSCSAVCSLCVSCGAVC